MADIRTHLEEVLAERILVLEGARGERVTKADLLGELLSERILVLDGAWGVPNRGGTRGSPAGPLLHACSGDDRERCLSPGEARLRPRAALAEVDS